MGVMSGTLDLVQRSYIGTHIRDGVLHFSPRLTSAARRAVVLHAVSGDPDPGDVRRRPADLAAHREGVSPPVKVAVGDEVRELRPGDRCTFEPQPDPSPHQQAQD